MFYWSRTVDSRRVGRFLNGAERSWQAVPSSRSVYWRGDEVRSKGLGEDRHGRDGSDIIVLILRNAWNYCLRYSTIVMPIWKRSYMKIIVSFYWKLLKCLWKMLLSSKWKIFCYCVVSENRKHIKRAYKFCKANFLYLRYIIIRIAKISLNNIYKLFRRSSMQTASSVQEKCYQLFGIVLLCCYIILVIL